ncbi:MAG: hypothetical protein RAO75_07370 [Candidatus Chlorobium antarcticum]|jgi:hypothetical protein|nr:hypothetical protein [Candidatus Chlorobium antarcticum]
MEKPSGHEELKALCQPTVAAMVGRWAEGNPLNPDSSRSQTLRLIIVA